MNNIDSDKLSLSRLKKKVDMYNLEFHEDMEFDESGIIIIIDMLNNNPDFYSYLINDDFDSFELTTVVFSEIKYFSLEKINIGKTDCVKKIFNYLENLIINKNNEAINLIIVGFLEIVGKEEFNKMKPYMKDKLIFEYNKLAYYGGYGWNK